MKRFLIFLVLFSVNAVLYSQTLVYYDPDGNLRRIVDINAEGNKLFSKIGVKFFVVADENAFNNFLKQYNPEYFIMNSMIYESKKGDLNLEAISVFTRNKRFTYTKKVITFQQDFSFGDLANKVLASSFKDVSLIIPSGVRVLKVPKDLDALLAVKFKQADFALVSDTSIEVFKSISPVDFGLMKVVYTSKEIFNPVLCYVQGRGNLGKAREIERVFFGSESKQLLNLLMYDDISNDPKIISKIK